MALTSNNIHVINFIINLDLPQIIASMTLTSEDSMINSLDMNQILLGLIHDLDSR